MKQKIKNIIAKISKFFKPFNSKLKTFFKKLNANFKKDLALNISLLSILAFVIVHIVLVTLNVFEITSFNFSESFNYTTSYILTSVSLLVSIGLTVVFGLKKIQFPTWLKIAIYVCVFFFFNTFYVLSLYTNMYKNLPVYVCIAFFANITSLSLFFNLQKSQNGKLQTTKAYTTTSVCMFSMAICLFVELLITIVEHFAFPTCCLTGLYQTIIASCTMIFVTVVMTTIYAISLSKSKRVINKCLVIVKKDNQIKKSVKD